MTKPLHFDGHPVAPWIVPRLHYARAHGWTGQVISGYRTDAEQLAAATRFARQLGRPLSQVYPSGPLASAHTGLSWPRGAVDVTDPDGLHRAMDHWRGSRKRNGLVGGGSVLSFDRAHFSANGH